MLKIRYDIESKQLSGWASYSNFTTLKAREGEAVEALDITKPDSDDYEYFAYDSIKLVSSGKQRPTPREPIRDYGKEIDTLKIKIDEIKVEIEKLKEIKDGT